MLALKDHGHEFVLFSFGPISDRHWELVRQCDGLIDAWEIGCAWHDLDAVLDTVRAFRNDVDVPVYLTKLRSKEEMEDGGEMFYHVINHGFSTVDAMLIDELSKREDIAAVVDGVVCRVAGDSAPWRAVIDAGEFSARYGFKASVHLRMSTASPAAAICDDLWSANRVAEAQAAAMTQTDVSVFVDTFADVDRGYFVRNGVVDRRYNPRMAFHVIRHLNGALNANQESLRPVGAGAFAGGRIVSLAGDAVTHTLVMPDREFDSIAIPRPHTIESNTGQVWWSDLQSGEISEAGHSSDGNGNMRIIDHPSATGPILLTFA